jgi:radical SAM protein with 4Fe4S-binding SPASM domain
MSTLIETTNILSDNTVKPGINSALKAMIGDKRCFMPTHMAIETISACNADCIMCPSSKMKREKAVMRPEVHQTILRKITDWGAPISLITHAGLGEPLLDRMLEERIQQEKKTFTDSQIIVYTNGSLLDEERALKLIDSGVDIVSFSINGFRKETYEAVMKLPRDNTYRNVERFCEIKQKLGSKINICVSAIKTDLCSQQELEEYKQFWETKNVQVIMPPWISWGNHFEHSIRKHQLPCFYIWKTMMIDQDGTVKMCCEDYNTRYPLGNIMTQSPSEIFNSARMRQQRTDQLNSNFSWPEICKNCTETFEPARDFWMNSPALIAINQKKLLQNNKQGYLQRKHERIDMQQTIKNNQAQQTYKNEKKQMGLDTFLDMLDSLTHEQYKYILGHMLAKGLDINIFDYPKGIWPPPTPARVYIEQFLRKYQSLVKGRCVEFCPPVYKDMFINNTNVWKYDIWNLSPGEGITIVADLQNATNVPSDCFDTIICTHVLSAIRNIWEAVEEIHRVLKVGGLVLCTVPAVLQEYAPNPRDYWRLTKDSVRDLFANFSKCEIHSMGNPATVSGSPFFLMSYHFPESFMQIHSEKCPSIIAVAAWK